jgi:2-polyprenyl-3-methyl-5-hydroxy-6-metoxy-1,4-benzoquinol methylase
MHQHAILKGYAADAGELVRRFEALQTEVVLAPVMDLLPSRPGKTLDVGAGTGRDAAWLAGRGFDVLAVEPVDELRQAGQALHRGINIEWLDDSLPLLRRTKARGETFDLILSIAMWQHLPSDQHHLALASLSPLAAPGGRMILSVRYGPGAPNRICFAADTDRLVAAARDNGLVLVARRRAGSV